MACMYMEFDSLCPHEFLFVSIWISMDPCIHMKLSTRFNSLNLKKILWPVFLCISACTCMNFRPCIYHINFLMRSNGLQMYEY